MQRKSTNSSKSQRKRKTIKPLGIKMDLDLKDLSKSLSSISDDLGKKVDRTVKNVSRQVSKILSEELKGIESRFSKIERRLGRLSRPGRVKPRPKAKAKKVRAVKTCSVRGCNKPYAAKGLCKSHYNKMYRERKGAKVAGKVSKPVSKKGVKGKRTCTVEGCDRPYLARGYCKRHYEQWRKGKLG